MGVEEGAIRDVHPSVLAVTGPQQYEQVVGAVHEVVPPRQDHDPRIDLVPPQGVKLTPRHYAYLKISEGCNHSCSFCIIPSMRGKLVSRPVGEVLSEAEGLARAGVKELLVISQDTSAYGVDLKYRSEEHTSELQSRPHLVCRLLLEKKNKTIPHAAALCRDKAARLQTPSHVHRSISTRCQRTPPALTPSCH